MAVTIQAGAGHCMSTIADMYRFTNYRIIYDHANNATLRRDCPNPNQLIPNTAVFIPDRQEGGHTVPVTQVHNYVIFTTQVKLRLVLVDSNNHPVANKDWNLTMGAVHVTGHTGANGLAEGQIQANFTQATFKIRFLRPAAAAAAAPAAAAMPPYPPPIHAADFTDPYDAAYTQRAENDVEWTLEIGSLQPFKVIPGVKARLNNLGFHSGIPDASDTPLLHTAVTNYQRAYHLPQTGVWGDIMNDLRDRHDLLR